MTFLSHHFRQIFIKNYKYKLKNRPKPYQSNHLHLNEHIDVYPAVRNTGLINEVDNVVFVSGFFKP